MRGVARRFGGGGRMRRVISNRRRVNEVHDITIPGNNLE